MIDGVPMVGVDEGGDTRAFRFDAIPAVLLSEIAINKSLTPAMQADAIVASIDLKTYSPMARKGLHINGDLGYGFINLGKGEQRQGSLRLSWANDSFGVVIGGSHYRRKQLTDNREVGLFDEPSNAADATFGPTEIDIRQYEIERWNNGLFAGLEFQPSDGLRLWLKGIFTEFNDDEQRNQWELRLDRAASGFRNLASGDLVSVPMRGSFNYGEYRNRNYIGTFGADYEADDGLSIDLRLNYARTDNNTYLPLVQASTSGLASPSLTYDRSDPRFPIVTLYQTVAGATAGSVVRGPLASGFNQASLNPASATLLDARQKTVSDSYTAKLDVEKEFGSFKLTGGLFFVDRKVDGNNFSFVNQMRHRHAWQQCRHAVQRQQLYHLNAWETGFPLGFTLNYADNRAIRRDIDRLLPALATAGLFNPSASVPVTDRYSQDEKLAGYVMASAELGRATVTGGLRIEHYTLDNSGTLLLGTVATPLTVRQSHTDLFPSLNARFELADDLVFRFAGSARRFTSGLWRDTRRQFD